MAGIIFSEASGVNKSIYGECQAPIQMFVESYDSELKQSSILPKVFKMYDSENFGDYLTEMTSMAGPQPVGENGAYPKDDMQEGYGKMLRYVTWKDSFAISEEMIEDNKLLDLTGAPRNFMDAWNLGRESFGAAVFGAALRGEKFAKFRGMSFDVTSADGAPVFHTAHVPKTKGAKQCNCFSNEFSVETLDMAETAMQQFKHEGDQQGTIAPDTILIANKASLKRKVFAAIGSDIDPVESTHAFNYQYGRWNVIIWPFLNQFLTKGTEPWILMDSKFNEKYGGAVWGDRTPLKLKSTLVDDPGANVWYGRQRFNATFRNWRAFCAGGMAGGTDLSTLDL